VFRVNEVVLEFPTTTFKVDEVAWTEVVSSTVDISEISLSVIEEERPPAPTPPAPTPPPVSPNVFVLFTTTVNAEGKSVVFVKGWDEQNPGVVVLPFDYNKYSEVLGFYGSTEVPFYGQRTIPISTDVVYIIPYLGFRVSSWKLTVVGKLNETKTSIVVTYGTGDEVPLSEALQTIEERGLEPPYWVFIDVYVVSGGYEVITPPGWITSSNIVSVPVGEFEEVSTTWSFTYETGVPLRSESRTFSFRYLAGITTPSVLHYQRYRIPEESWELVYRSPTQSGGEPVFSELSNYLLNGKIRYFRVLDGVAHFLIVTTSHPISLFVVSVPVDPNRNDYGQVSLRGVFPVLADADDESKKEYPTFGAVAEGHGGVVYVTHKDAIYVPFELEGEILRVSLLSEQYQLPRTRWGLKSVLAVPEGFIFVPEGILWDMETFWNFKVEDEGSGGDRDRVVPFYTENFIGYMVRTGEYGNNPSENVTRAYVWGGIRKGMVKIRLETGDNKPLPIYLGGDQLGDEWVAFTATDHWEESVIVAHKIVLDQNNPSDLSKAKLTLSWKGSGLPLPFSSPVRQGGVPPGWWETWLFSVKILNKVIYFGRLWDRIYKYDPRTDQVVLAHVFPSILPDGNLVYLTEEEVASLHLSLDETSGKLYGCRVTEGGYIQIWRQQYSYVPPNPPDILFPTSDLSVPKRFEVIFQPQVDERPQEFAVEFSAVRTDTGQRMTLYYDSRIHRSLFFVSTDGGTSYSPMTGPITVTSSNRENLRVMFTLPVELPPSTSVTIKVYSIVPTP